MVDKKDKKSDAFDFTDDFPDFEDNENEFSFDDDDDNDVFKFDDTETVVTPEADEYHIIDGTPETAKEKQSNMMDKIRGEDPKRLMIISGIVTVFLIVVVYFILRLMSPPVIETVDKESKATTGLASSSQVAAPVNMAAQPTQVASDVAETIVPAQTQTSTTTTQVTTANAPAMTNKTPAQTASQVPASQAPLTQASAPIQTTTTVSTEKQPSLREQTTTSTSTLSEPVSQPVVIPPSSDKVEQLLAQIVQQNTALQKRIESLETQLSDINSKVDDIPSDGTGSDSRIARMEESVSAIDKKVSRVNHALQSLVSAAYQEIKTEKKIIAARRPVGVRAVKEVEVAEGPSYVIQAIIPGRAWLKNTIGQTITVTFGDLVAGFGTVTTIDAENGIVLTSSGRKILYAMDGE